MISLIQIAQLFELEGEREKASIQNSSLQFKKLGCWALDSILNLNVGTVYGLRRSKLQCGLHRSPRMRYVLFPSFSFSPSHDLSLSLVTTTRSGEIPLSLSLSFSLSLKVWSNLMVAHIFVGIVCVCLDVTMK